MAADQPLPIEFPQSTVTTDLVVFSAKATKSSGGLEGKVLGTAEITNDGATKADNRETKKMNRLTA